MGGFGKADRLTPGANRTRGGERMRRQTGKRPNRPPFLLFGLSLPPLLQERLSESVRRQLLPSSLPLGGRGAALVGGRGSEPGLVIVESTRG